MKKEIFFWVKSSMKVDFGDEPRIAFSGISYQSKDRQAPFGGITPQRQEDEKRR